MKQICTTGIIIFLTSSLFAGSVEKTYYFSQYRVQHNGEYQYILFDHTLQSGLSGEPVLPYHEVVLLLPPGESAIGIEVVREEEIVIPGDFTLFPQQEVQPVSAGIQGTFLKHETIYTQNDPYPESPAGHLITQLINGYPVALSSFTPLMYYPANQAVSYFRKVTVRIRTAPDPKIVKAHTLLPVTGPVSLRIERFIQNPDMTGHYSLKSPGTTDYELLIITPQQYTGGFQELVDFYTMRGIQSQITTTEYIQNTISGFDLAQKIRSYIRQQYTEHAIGYVLLGGDVEHIPFRGFYCYVQSGSGYSDNGIPADLYYSALDGEWNDTSLVGGNITRWGEPGEDDLLPEVAVARFPFSTAGELENMVHKSVMYQNFPIINELRQPYMVSEHLYWNPLTFGSDYLELLIDDHTDNGYFTHGIPSDSNQITKLSDSIITPPNTLYQWPAGTLIAGINDGHSFIHHCGHANTTYLMRLSNASITNATFSQVDGITHNYTLLYSHGCNCGGFDHSDCITEKMVTIDNFLVACVSNSRYGWFNEGQTEGPSAHLHREFVSALYNDTVEDQIREIGAAHVQSKIKTAPWVTAPGQWEPGALRWCFYDCNVLGDPAMPVWTGDPYAGIANPAPITGIPTIEAPENSLVSIPITVTGFTSVTALSLVLEYNPLVLNYLGFSNVPACLNGLTVVNSVVTPALHRIVVSWSGTSPATIPANGILADLSFTYLSGTTVLRWNNTYNLGSGCAYQGTSGTSLTDIPTSLFYLNGEIHLQPTYKISGVITYNNAVNTPLDSVRVYLMKNSLVIDSVLTTATGYYEFNSIPNSVYQLEFSCHKPWGGVNGTDALKILRHFTGLEILTEPVRLQAADVNNSGGGINGTDALKVNRRFVGLDTTFERGNWTFSRVTDGGNQVIVNGSDVVQDIYGLFVGDVNASAGL